MSETTPQGPGPGVGTPTDTPPPPTPPTGSGPLSGLNPLGEPATPVWRLRWFQVALATLVTLAVASYVLPPVFRMIYMTRPVLLPVLVGLALAYAFNPLVTWAQRRHRMPRVFSAAVILIWFFGLLGLAFSWLTGPVVGQAKDLARDLPGYVEASTRAVTEYLEIPGPARAAIEEVVEGDFAEAAAVAAAVLPDGDAANEASRVEPVEAAEAASGSPAALGEELRDRVPTTIALEVGGDDAVQVDAQVAVGGGGEAVAVDASVGEPVPSAPPSAEGGLFTRVFDHLQTIELSTISSTGLRVLDVGASTVIGVLGLAGYLAVAGLVVCFVFFFATWRWPAFVAWWLPYVPASAKKEVGEVVSRMDHAVAAFLRGRLIQAAILAVILSVGFTLVGTPGALILGIAGGLLGLVPYAGAIVWPVAVVLSVMSGLALEDGPQLWWAVLAPTIVYAVGQGLDAWVIEPTVQGQATDLDALTVLLVVLAGGAVAGLLGLLLAIPVAACIKILWREAFGPRLRAIARAS